MKQLVFLRAALLVPVLAPMLVSPAGAWAQTTASEGPPNNYVPVYPDADALAAQMRILGANPRDEGALINAGELTLKIGDIDAAAAFFARADRINPSNARTKAGAARALLHMERPGEALRLFNEAEALGIDRAVIAAERGLAFDLIGEQERAQRQYRLALTRGQDGETLRRYALSLGIVGKREEAFVQIDSLLRQSDRAAWRVRAFVLAMSGDVAGAEAIASSMLPGNMASGLLPFFRVLASLGPVDRAFAVHFGEVRASPQRVADARLIPTLPPLAPEPVRPSIALAAVTPPPAARASDRRRDRDRRRQRGQMASVVPPAVAMAPPLPPPPSAERAPVGYGEAVAALPVGTQLPAPSRAPAPALASTRPQPVQPQVALPDPNSTAGRVLAEVRARQAREAAARPPVQLAATTPRDAYPPAVSSAADGERGAVPIALTELPPPSGTLKPSQLVPVPMPSGTTPPVQTATRAPVPVPVAPPPTSPTTLPATAPVVTEARKTDPVGDSILARIVATIGVPAAELDVAPIRPPVVVAAAPEPAPAPAPSAAARPAAADPAQVAIDRKAAAKAAAAKLAADKLAAEKKAAAKKVADEKAAKAKALKADPERIWVQVAGGASVRDLPREWKKLADKAPAAFKGRSAYTTPLRFTNRVLAGPFKTDDAAQAFVNQIAKSGLTGFVFVSEAGQKIDKLPAK